MFPDVEFSRLFPATFCIALKSAADVRVGEMNKPLVIPFAPPVWFIDPVSCIRFVSPVPLVGLIVADTFIGVAVPLVLLSLYPMWRLCYANIPTAPYDPH